MRKTVIAILAIAVIFTIFAKAGSISIGPETPFFEKPDAGSKVVFTSSSEMELEALDAVRGQFRYDHLAGRPWLPLNLDTEFREVQLPEIGAAWVSDDLKYDKTVGPVPTCQPRKSLFIPLAIFYGIMASALFIALRLGFGTLLRPDWRGMALALLTAVSLRNCISITVIYLSGGIMLTPTDENNYFEIAKDIISLHNPENAWLHTIGNAFWHIPFILATGAKDYMDICASISLFNSLIISSACIVLTWLIVEHLSGSRGKAFAAAALLAVLPFISFPVELFGYHVFKNVMAIPDIDPGSYRLYDIVNAIGYNGQSDTPSAFICLLCLALALFMKPKAWQFAAISALFGFACLIRLNNVFLSPLLAFLFWRKLCEDGFRLQRAFGVGILCSLAFILVFGWQLAVNAWQFGSPFKLPYVLHPNDAAKGFVLSRLPQGIDFLLGCNYMVVCLAAAALPFIKVKWSRVALSLWCLPMIIFFCGYAEVGGASIRFVLICYPAFLAALAMGAFWDELDLKGRLALAGTLLAACALCSPCHRMTPTFPWDLENYGWGENAVLALNMGIPALCVGVAAWLYGSSKKELNRQTLLHPLTKQI